MATYTVSLNNYTYTLDDSTYTCSAVWAGGTSVTAVTGLMDSILYEGNFYKLTSLSGCFENLTSLKYPPRIPNTVETMYQCFMGCSALEYPPKIPNSVSNMNYCFCDCSSLFVPDCFIIPASVTTMDHCFYSCTNMTNLPVILGCDVCIDYAFSETKIADFRGLPKISSAISSLPTSAYLVYGSEELNHLAINNGVYYENTASNPYQARTPSIWPKFTTTTGTISLKSILTKLVEQANNITAQFLDISMNGLSVGSNYRFSSYSSLLTNLLTITNIIPRICSYMTTNGIKYRHYKLTDATAQCMSYYYYSADGFVVCRSIHSPDVTTSTSRQGRNSSFTFYNTISKTYSTGYSALLESGVEIWNSRGLFKHMRTGSTGTGLITINGTISVSNQTVTYTYESWGNSTTSWTETLISELFLQMSNSIDYTYNNVAW